MNTEAKRLNEKRLLAEMIALYCRGQAHGPGLCTACQALRDYAWQRTDRCPHMGEKTFCANCITPCYKPDMRARIRAVMRYSGPRMLLRHPCLLIKHAYYRIRGDHP